MAREDGAARAGGGGCAPVLRRARAAQRDRRAGTARRRASRRAAGGRERLRRAMRVARRGRARDYSAMLELWLSAWRVIAAGGARRSYGSDPPCARAQTGGAVAKHDRAADSQSRQRASPRRISENHASRTDRRPRASTRRQARAISSAGAGRGRVVAKTLAGRGRALLLCLSGRERARAFVTRTDVETIKLAEVGVADDLEAPQQSQAQRAPDSSDDFHGKWKAAQRFDANVEPRFLLS